MKSAVVMSHLRPGVIARIGLGYAALSAMNPQLVSCAIAGFGQSGTCRDEAGWDAKIQALSAIMSPTGHKDIAPTRGLPGARHAVRHDRRVRRILGIVRAYS